MPKNNYFSLDRQGHRQPEQVWNVQLWGGYGDVSIWVQGGTNVGFARDTTFAKKHLLTFKGGKSAGRGGKERDKMNRIWQKRLSANNAANPKRAKYGGRVNNNGMNTMIRCDRFPAVTSDPDSLPQLLGLAMKNPKSKPSLDKDMGHAEIELAADQIWTAHETGNPGNRRFEVATQGDPYRLYTLTFGYMQKGNQYQVFHLVSMN